MTVNVKFDFAHGTALDLVTELLAEACANVAYCNKLHGSYSAEDDEMLDAQKKEANDFLDTMVCIADTALAQCPEWGYTVYIGGK